MCKSISSCTLYWLLDQPLPCAAPRDPFAPHPLPSRFHVQLPGTPLPPIHAPVIGHTRLLFSRCVQSVCPLSLQVAAGPGAPLTRLTSPSYSQKDSGVRDSSHRSKTAQFPTDLGFDWLQTWDSPKPEALGCPGPKLSWVDARGTCSGVSPSCSPLALVSPT